MTTQSNWLTVKPALNWLRTTYAMGLSGGYNQPLFWLSPDTPELIRQRITDRAYTGAVLGGMLPFENNFAATQRDVLPATADTSVDGKITLRWLPSRDETVYPVWDTLAKTARTGPPRSFALYIGEAHQIYSVMLTNKLEVTQTTGGSKGMALYLVGTVGPKGSGADLELEAIEDWRHGRPLYIPGNELTLPFRLVRSLDGTSEPQSDKDRWFERWGPRGNIARSGTNGLTAASYAASSGVAEYAFNGNRIAGKLYGSADDAPIDPVWRALKPGTDLYTRDNRSRALSQPLPSSQNFTIELKLPDGIVPRGSPEGFWGMSIGDVRFDVFYGGYYNSGYLLKDGDAVVKVDAPVPEGCLIRYVVREGRNCEVQVNGTPVGSLTITGDALDLSGMTHVGYPGRDLTYGTYVRRPIEFLRITNDDVAQDAADPLWLQVNFPRKVTGLSGLTVIAGDGQTDRLPKTCTVQVSPDGTSFVDHETIELVQLTEQRLLLTEKVDAHAVRLVVVNNHGSPHCTEIGELEVHYELPVDTKLTQTGGHRNITLLGTNGLTEDSFTASRSDNGGRPYGAFNGWQDNRRINQQAPASNPGYGLWEADPVSYDQVKQWLQVDFGQRVSGLTGLSIRPYEWQSQYGIEISTSMKRAPKEITVRVSDDGDTFTDVWDGTLEATGFQRVTFAAPLTTRYLRVFVHTTRALEGQTSHRYVSIRELEIYQELPEPPEEPVAP